MFQFRLQQKCVPSVLTLQFGDLQMLYKVRDGFVEFFVDKKVLPRVQMYLLTVR